jgi:hypothetical protein
MPDIDDVSLSWEFVEEATLPFVEFEPISNYRAGKMYHYANHYSLGSLGLKIYEDSRGKATQYLEAWRRKIIDLDSGLYNHPNDYKKTIKITIMDVAKMTVMFYEYIGCWPTRTDAYNMTSGSSERIVASVEMSVDEMRVKFGKFDSNAIPSIIDTVGVDFPPKFNLLPSKFPGNFVDMAIGEVRNVIGF